MTLDILLHKEIDSIIDECKASGLYNLDQLNFQNLNDDCVHVDDIYPSYSSSESIVSGTREQLDDVTNNLNCVPDIVINEKNYICTNVPRSDSEVTVLGIKKEKLNVKNSICSRWEEIHDKAVPGDGTHLGESPSLVNLVTFITNNTDIKREAGEYMIPISTWDPVFKQKLTAIESNITIQSNMITPIEEIHRSLNITTISNSRLNLPYMMKRKQSPRPGALFSKNVDITKHLHSENNDTFIDISNNNDLHTIKAPPIAVKRKTFAQKCRKFFQMIACGFCLSNNEDMNNKKLSEIAVQTDNEDN